MVGVVAAGAAALAFIVGAVQTLGGSDNGQLAQFMLFAGLAALSVAVLDLANRKQRAP